MWAVGTQDGRWKCSETTAAADLTLGMSLGQRAPSGAKWNKKESGRF